MWGVPGRQGSTGRVPEVRQSNVQDTVGWCQRSLALQRLPVSWAVGQYRSSRTKAMERIEQMITCGVVTKTYVGGCGKSGDTRASTGTP